VPRQSLGARKLYEYRKDYIDKFILKAESVLRKTGQVDNPGTPIWEMETECRKKDP
jgi:hypothetical protein